VLPHWWLGVNRKCFIKEIGNQAALRNGGMKLRNTCFAENKACY
jgi:hypothetical protein